MLLFQRRNVKVRDVHLTGHPPFNPDFTPEAYAKTTIRHNPKHASARPIQSRYRKILHQKRLPVHGGLAAR